MKRFAAVALGALLLVGCAVPVVKLPSASPVTITVISGARQSPYSGTDHLIPDSQVYVGGNRRTGDYAAAILGGGLLGYSVGSAVGAAMHASDLGDEAASALGMKFNGIVVEALKTQPAGQAAAGPAIRILKANDLSAAIELEPTARLLMVEKPDSFLVFVLNANFDVPGVQGKNSHITYLHGGLGSRPIHDGRNGWADQGGAPFRAAATRAFTRMTDVFKADLRGELKREGTGLKRVEWQSPDTKVSSAGLVVYEQADYVALMPLDKEGAPFIDTTVIVDRSQVKPRS